MKAGRRMKESLALGLLTEVHVVFSIQPECGGGWRLLRGREGSPNALCAESNNVTLNVRTRSPLRVIKANLPFMWPDDAVFSVEKNLDMGTLKEKGLFRKLF